MDEDQLIESVERSLRGIDYQNGKEASMESLLGEIMEISKNIRNKIITAGQTSIKISVDLRHEPQEIQLATRIDTRSHIQKLFGRGEKPTEEILVLTPVGYRIATPETLERHRYQTVGMGEQQSTRPRVVQYSTRSSSMIHQILEKIHRALKA